MTSPNARYVAMMAELGFAIPRAQAGAAPLRVVVPTRRATAPAVPHRTAQRATAKKYADMAPADLDDALRALVKKWRAEEKAKKTKARAARPATIPDHPTHEVPMGAVADIQRILADQNISPGLRRKCEQSLRDATATAPATVPPLSPLQNRILAEWHPARPAPGARLEGSSLVLEPMTEAEACHRLRDLRAIGVQGRPVDASTVLRLAEKVRQ
jgi:hypothetical protein